MSQRLPKLGAELMPTRDYMREVALVLGSLQRGFLPKHPRDWQHGLEVNLRGLSTQSFEIAGETMRASLDLVKFKVRFAGQKWPLHEFIAPEILQALKDWLTEHGQKVTLDELEFAAGVMQFDTAQAAAYAEALWWFNDQFEILKATLSEGVTAPVLLYPHHFDLSLVWFPFDDERQFGLGWSTGDETILEPYVYLTAYPELAGFTDITLPTGAYWQPTGFSGAILPYTVLQASQQPAELLQTLAADTMRAGRQLLG